MATPGFDRILHAGVEIIPRAPVSKGARNFPIRSSNPYARFDGRTTKIGRRGKPPRGRARITLRCLRSAWSFDVRRIGDGGRKLWRVERHKNRVFSIGGGKRTVSHNEPSRDYRGWEGRVVCERIAIRPNTRCEY